MAQLTSTGKSIAELIDEINVYIRESGNAIKIDYDPDAPSHGTGMYSKEHPRYIYAHTIDFHQDRAHNGIYDAGHVFERRPDYPQVAYELGGADIEVIHQQVMEFAHDHPRYERPVYVRKATPAQWSEHIARGKAAVGENPEAYGYVHIQARDEDRERFYAAYPWLHSLIFAFPTSDGGFILAVDAERAKEYAEEMRLHNIEVVHV